MIKSRLLVPIFSMVLALGTIGISSWAGEVRPTSWPSSAPNQSVDSLSFDQWRNSLKEERQLLERQTERQYGAIEKLIEKALWVFGVLAGGGLGLFAWLFGKSKQDFTKAISETFEKQAQEIVEKEAAKLRQRYDDLRNEVENLSAYKRRQVVWVSKPETNNNQETVLSALYASGIENVSIVTPENGKEFDTGDPDLVILTFDNTDEARRLLAEIVDRLKGESPPIPLLIYTFSFGGNEIRLGSIERKILEGFDWYVPVNFPAQLLAQTQLLIRRNSHYFGGGNGYM